MVDLFIVMVDVKLYAFNDVKLLFYIHIYIYDPPSKSIVYAWFKIISYCSLGGALSLSSVLFKSTRNTAKMHKNARELASRIQI
jgi:hypothetical protein